jgi:hypothetical protein
MRPLALYIKVAPGVRKVTGQEADRSPGGQGVLQTPRTSRSVLFCEMKKKKKLISRRVALSDARSR